MKYPGLKTKFYQGNADEFGKYYVGSSLAKKNRLKNKILKKK